MKKDSIIILEGNVGVIMGVICNWFKSIFGKSGIERPSPSDIIPGVSLAHYAAPVVDANLMVALSPLNLPLTLPPKVWMPIVADTGSMDGLMDYGHHTILIAGQNPPEQQALTDWLFQQPVGNIVVVRDPPNEAEFAQTFILHRLKKFGSDSQGRFFVTRGDNNNVDDPWKWRDANFKWLVIGILY